MRRFFWTVYAALYDALWDNLLLARIGATIAALLPPYSRVVEVGAGTGIVTECLMSGGHRVTACEPDRAMAARFALRLPDVPLVRCRFEELEGDMSYVVAVNVVHLLPDPIQGVRQMQALAGSTGTVIIVSPEPRAGLLSVAWEQYRWGIGIFRMVCFVAAHLFLGPLAVICGVHPGAGTQWVNDRRLPRTEPFGKSFRIMFLPADYPLSDEDCRPRQPDSVSR